MKCIECGSSDLEQKLELWVKIEGRDDSTLGHANGPLGGDDCYRDEATEAVDYGNYDATQVFWCHNCSDICEAVREDFEGEVQS